MPDILNVTIDPILPDINYMVKNHIETCVRKFNKQFICAQISEHKQKIKVLEKQLEMLDNDAFGYSDIHFDEENEEENQYQAHQENIQLSIDEIENDGVGDKDNNEIKVKRTTTSKTFQSIENNNVKHKDVNINTTSSDVNVPVCVETFEQFRADKQPTSSDSDNNIIHSSVISDHHEKTSVSIDDISFEKGDNSENTEEGQDSEHDDEEEEEEEEPDVDEEVVGVFEIEIDDKVYFTTDEINGTLYEIDDDGEPGDEVGKLSNGSPVFNNNGLPSQ